jgi:hypothetical protein
MLSIGHEEKLWHCGTSAPKKAISGRALKLVDVA